MKEILTTLVIVAAVALKCDGAQEGKSMQNANHLIHEKSPYLLQHAHNPVDWYPWGKEAFEKAKRENKPILISIGYSTCHWCHVMEHESFSNPKIAEVMNRYLVSIKIDREERPDIDKIYMTAVQALTGTGGWPLNVFLTPDLKPFFGGTYFPPDERFGRPGWGKLIENLGKSWQSPEGRKKIMDSADHLTQQLQIYLAGNESRKDKLDPAILANAFEAFRNDFDQKLGGFGHAPKFPMPVNQNFLLRYYARAKGKKELAADAKSALEMPLFTLRKIAEGGIYDQIGGGFHRYSTDERWHIPHFEKMLYDNAQIAVNDLEAYQITHEHFFADISRETLDYILRDMTHPAGGFYSAEDADSIPPELAEKGESSPSKKREGAFYLWRKREIKEVLGSDTEIFCARFGIKDQGNVEWDPQAEFEDKNCLFIARSTTETAQAFGKSAEETIEIIERSKQKLFEARTKRPRPHLDDKIITSWNGLTISAFAKAYQVLGDAKYLQAAERAATFIQTHSYDADKQRLYRRWRDGERKIAGTADDYAFLAQALIDLYEASFDPKWLQWAITLTEELNRRFYDPELGGFYMTESKSDENLIARVKEDMDNVEPAASSVATLNLLRLAQFTEREDLRKAAEKTLQFFASQMKEQPRSLPQMLSALDFAFSKPYQIVIAGKKDSVDTQTLLKEIRSRFIPNKIIILLDGKPDQKPFSDLAFLENIVPIKNKASAYVCVNYACELPTNDVKTLGEILER